MIRVFAMMGLALASAIGTNATGSDITVARLFSDHMVLQQECLAPIWGTADPQQKIVITFNEQKFEGVANAQGEWRIPVQTPAAGGPYQLVVQGAGVETKVILKDVMVGEVWLCGGQSNMEWPVDKSDFPEREMDSAKEFPSVRLFRVGRNSSVEPLSQLQSADGWDVCNPQTVKNFSAVGYFFGRRLNRQLQVPIGLISVNWGGTNAETWTSRQALTAEGTFSELLAAAAAAENPAGPNIAGNLFHGMIAPLKGFQFQGVIWYQGESNVGRGDQYRRLFPTLIADWRSQLAGGREFPFYFVQLAPFRYSADSEEALAEVWDAQLHSFRYVPNTGLVVTTDIGNLEDIHPRNKQEVGERLARWALAGCYANRLSAGVEPTIPSGPLYRSAEIRDGRVWLNFDYVGEGLAARDKQPLQGFTICGADQKFVPAQAEIVGQQVSVWSPEVAVPVAVRMGWNQTAVTNLINSAQLPASPFRTDQFPLLSKGREK